MALNLKVYRNVFAGGAVLAILIVSGFYVRGILKSRRELPKIAKAVASDLVQSTKDFTFSKSEGGHTLFTIHAAEARQFKDTGRAELHDVNIVV